MPTRVLYWNVNNFTLRKIVPRAGAGPAIVNQTADRRTFMRQIVNANAPNVIVVVEVFGRVREVTLEGSVLFSNIDAGRAVRTLLTDIRALLGNTWCLVPPVRLGSQGQSEAVAVYYDAAHLQFTGPNFYWQVWNGVSLGQSQPVVPAIAPAQVVDYPLVWKNCLPNPANAAPLNLARTSNTPDGAGGMINMNEWQLAGRCMYYPGAAPMPPPILPPLNRINFPNAGCRGPFWTQFVEVAGGRTVNLFSVHTSPASAWAAVVNMQLPPEMSAAPAANSVNVILGDFNVDSFSTAANAYNWMILGHYGMALDPRDPATGNVALARQPYVMTHLLPNGTARPFNNTGVPTDPQHNVYPRYGYMGSVFPALSSSGAIDNFFTAYPGGGAGLAANITVVNSVVGQPYNAFAAPAGVSAELTGGLPYVQRLNNAIPLAAAPGGINPPVDPIAFNGWPNFGKIYSTSDHLPVIMDV